MQLNEKAETLSDGSSEEDIPLRISRLLQTEKSRTCGEESSRRYRELHKERFAEILRLCRSEVSDPQSRVLDIGRSELTALLLSFYRNVYSLGLDLSVDDGGHRESRLLEAVPHITFDLRNSPKPTSWPECGRFDLIVFSEVIEHLSVAPEYVFVYLKALLASEGVLVCTTPNAAELDNRIRLALGSNPYDRLRLCSTNPGHIREYTKRELREIIESVGLHCKSHFYCNWRAAEQSPVKSAILKLLPSCRPSQTCVLKHR